MKTLILLFALLSSPALGAGPGAENDFGGRRVLLIGVDGCRPDALRAAMERGLAPNMKQLAEKGALTTQLFAGGEYGGATEQPTSSGPGWSSILTGVWRNKHRVKDNRFGGNRLAEFPHFMRRLKELKPDAWCASFCDWSEIHNFIADASRRDGAEFLDFKFTAPGDPLKKHQDWPKLDLAVRDAATVHLREANPDAMFVYFGQVDEIGHAVADPDGMFSPDNVPYLQGIGTVDSLIGDLLVAMRSRRTFADERWLVLITTDHGGRGTIHGGQSPEDRNIWLLADSPDLPASLADSPFGQPAIAHLVFRHLQLAPLSSWDWEPAPFSNPQ